MASLTKTSPVQTDNNAPADEDRKRLIEAGRKLFAQECTFLLSAVSASDFPPPDLPEFAFCGRSNVGKSSLINALTGHKSLARTSNTPGRTQQINFFRLGRQCRLVDLPGYGYAKASKSKIHSWTKLIDIYLRGRPNLRRACMLIDARHGLKTVDTDIMRALDVAAVSYQIVFTKTDKIKPSELATLEQRTSEVLRKHAAAFPSMIATSSVKSTGLEELRAQLAQVAEFDPIGYNPSA